MLKRLAILGSFGVFLLGSPGAAEDQQSKVHSEQIHASQAQQPVPPTHVIIDPTSATIKIKPEADESKKDPEQKPLPRFLGAEWIIVYITAIYVIISGLTLWAIKRQADTMETQAKDARNSAASSSATAQSTLSSIKQQTLHLSRQAAWQKMSAKAAMISAKAALENAKVASAQIRMMKDKERGRLRIEFGQPDLVQDPDPENGYELSFKLILDGTTQVYISESSCFVGIHESGDPVGEPWWNSMGAPKTITPEDRTYKGIATILTGERPWGEPFTGVDEARVALVREEKLHIFARGVITYDDLFGNEWELRFNNKWKYYWNFPPDSVDLTSGYWESVGDNGEYKAESKQPEPK